MGRWEKSLDSFYPSHSCFQWQLARNSPLRITISPRPHASQESFSYDSTPCSRSYFPAFFAIILSAILSYVAFGIMPLVTSWFFAEYGRPSMIRFAYASPIPGSVFNWSAVAVLMSIRSAAPAAAAAYGALGLAAGVPAASTPGRLISSPKQPYESSRFQRDIAPPQKLKNLTRSQHILCPENVREIRCKLYASFASSVFS